VVCDDAQKVALVTTKHSEAVRIGFVSCASVKLPQVPFPLCTALKPLAFMAHQYACLSFLQLVSSMEEPSGVLYCFYLDAQIIPD
jgi:hypothetical protein